MEKIQLIIFLIVTILYHEANAQNIEIEFNNVRIFNKSDFKGRDRKLNGRYIAGVFTIFNKSNDTIYVPTAIRSVFDNWGNDFKDKIYLTKTKKPFVSIKIIETSIEAKVEEIEEVVEDVEVVERISKRHISSVLKILPNHKLDCYFVKKTQYIYCKVNIKVWYNTYFNKTTLQNELKKAEKELKKVEKKIKKAKKKIKKKVKKIEKELNIYKNVAQWRDYKRYGGVVYKAPTRKEIEQFNKLMQERANIKYKIIGSMEYNEKYNKKKLVIHLKNIINVTPLKISSKDYFKILKP